MSNRNQEKSLSVSQFSGYLNKLKPQIELALPKHLSTDRMARLALTAFSSNEKLQKCDPKTIAASIMTAGQLGLEPGVNGAGFLIPYGRTCTFVPGWKGLVDLVSRSGRGTVYTGVIFSDQEYTFKDGAKRDLVVHNETDLIDPNEITHAFAIGWVKDAQFPIIELWSVKKITNHRNKYNKVGNSHYSYRDWEMYCRKVPLLQVIKYMPASVELANAIDLNSGAEMGHGVTIENGVVIDNGFAGDIEETPREKPPYPEKGFNESLPKWRQLIIDGKKTGEQIIAMAESAGVLSREQKDAIMEPINKRISYNFVLKNMRNAKDIDAIDFAADLIGEVSESGKRDDLMKVYKEIKEKMENEK